MQKSITLTDFLKRLSLEVTPMGMAAGIATSVGLSSGDYGLAVIGASTLVYVTIRTGQEFCRFVLAQRSTEATY
jgi:hypothetical protein